MRIEKVCVLGGSGFVGSALVYRLDAAGYDVKVLTRRREASKHLILLPRVDVVECDIMDDIALAQEIAVMRRALICAARAPAKPKS